MGGLTDETTDQATDQATDEATGGVSDEVLVARAYLSRVAEPGCVALWGLVREHGPVAVAEAVRSRTVDQNEVRTATEARARTADGHADLEAGQRHGMRLLVPESAAWPHVALWALENTGLELLRRPSRTPSSSGELIPPLALWVRGSLDIRSLSMRSVAIVGARNSTAYGDLVAKEFAFRLALRDFDVVSGGAFGIDAAAHRGALAADGRTVLISGRGLDLPYPSGNRALFDRVAESGLLMSESPPGTTPHRHRFLSRNRLIAALTTGTVVVEAAQRSGAKNTAAHCRGLDRPLMAVPGPVTSAMSIGAHELLQDDSNPAHLVTRVDDVLAVIGGAGDLAERRNDSAVAVRDLLDPVSRRVLEGLPGGRSAAPGEIALDSGVPQRHVLRVLPSLQQLGLVTADRSGRYRMSEKAIAAHRARPQDPVTLA